MDRGSEFAAELRAMLEDECGVTEKLIATQNSQANSMMEQVHQVIHQLIHMMGIKGQSDVNPDFGWNGVSAVGCQAAPCTVHTTQRATPAH
jgi:hypothetical protein